MIAHHWIWFPRPYMVKSLKNHLQNQDSFMAETWYIALRTQGLPSLFMMILGWPLTFLQQARSNISFICGKCWKVIFSIYVLKTNDWNLQCMIKDVKLFISYHQNLGVICHCPWVMYMYKIVKSLNVFFSETAWTIFTGFHMVEGSSVERKLTVC